MFSRDVYWSGVCGPLSISEAHGLTGGPKATSCRNSISSNVGEGNGANSGSVKGKLCSHQIGHAKLIPLGTIICPIGVRII